MFEEFGARPAFLPGYLVYELGPAFQGVRAAVVAALNQGQSGWFLAKPAVWVTQLDPLQYKIVSGFDRIKMAVQKRWESEIRSAFEEFELLEPWKPMQLPVLLCEVDILPRTLDKMVIPGIAERVGLVLEWTSKAHALRTLGKPEVFRFLEELGVERDKIVLHRTLRELRAVLKGGLPLSEREPDDKFGVLRRVTAAVVPFKGARTDLMYATPQGQRRLRFRRPFRADVQHAEPFMRDGVWSLVAEQEQIRSARVERQYVEGQLTLAPDTAVKIVTAEGVKGMTVPLDQDVECLGKQVDLVIDLRSVVGKGAHRRLVGEHPVYLLETYAGATDHGSPMHRCTDVPVRPEVAIFGGITPSDPVDWVPPRLARELDELWQMAEELGLTV